jgi:hypothetical protein
VAKTVTPPELKKSAELETDSRSPLLFRVFIVTVVIGALVAIVASALGYGIHRDELYYIDCGNRLDWGYVDHSLVVPLVARLLGGRFELLVVCVILLVAGIATIGAKWARMLGGSVSQQWLAAIIFVSMPGVVGGATTFGTVVFEQFAACVFGMSILNFTVHRNKGSVRLLLLSALLVGSVKPTGMLLVLAFSATMFIGNRSDLRTPLAIVTSGALGALPFLLWQNSHQWPILQFVAAQKFDRDPIALFFPMALMMFGPFALAATFGALRQLKWSASLWLAIAGVVLFALLGGKPYYCVPFFFPFAAELVVSMRNTQRWQAIGLAAAFIGVGLLMPVWPRIWLSQPYFPLQGSSRERIDWRDWTRQVVEIATQNDVHAVMAANYGQAGAIRQLAPPGFDVLCGHNQNAFWPNWNLASNRILVVGYSERWLRQRFSEVRQVGTLRNQFGVTNEENDRPVFLVDGKIFAVDLATELRHFD